MQPLVNLLTGQGVQVDAVEVTHGPLDATTFARRAAHAGCDVVFLAGGDGTICEAVQGLHEAGRGRLAVLPLGTGNDAARTLGLPLHLEEAARVALQGQRRRVDLMRLGNRVAFNAIGHVSCTPG